MAEPAKTETDVMSTDEFETHFEKAFAAVGDVKVDDPAKVDDPPADDPPAKTAEELAAEADPTKVDPPADDPPAKTAEEIAAEAAAAKAAKDAAAETRRVAKAAKDEEKRVAAEQKASESARALELTDDEKKYIAEVEKDFPEVKKALEVQERVLTTRFEQVMDKKLSELRAELEPIRSSVAATASDAHEAAILKAHADALDLLPSVETWIAAQPAFLQEGYNKVLDAGSAAQVIEFFDYYKKAAGLEADTTDPAAAAETARLKAEADADKAKKLASQEGVRSRAATRKNTDPPTFEEAFSRA